MRFCVFFFLNAFLGVFACVRKTKKMHFFLLPHRRHQDLIIIIIIIKAFPCKRKEKKKCVLHHEAAPISSRSRHSSIRDAWQEAEARSSSPRPKPGIKERLRARQSQCVGGVLFPRLDISVPNTLLAYSLPYFHF